MTRIAKLVLISALTGALGVLGCSEDTGGTGGSGGTGVACGGTPPRTIEAGFQVAEGGVTCVDPLAGVIMVPITVKLAAKPSGTLAEGENDFELQVETTIEEDTVSSLSGLVGVAEIAEDSVGVGSDNDTGLVNVAEAPVPCTVDFTADPDNNGNAGPVTVVTPVTTDSFTVTAEGTVTLTAEEITFDIASPVPLKLTTRDESGGGGNGGAGGASGAPCTWDVKPSLTFEAGVGGNGGNGGDGGGGGNGGGGG